MKGLSGLFGRKRGTRGSDVMKGTNNEITSILGQSSDIETENGQHEAKKRKRKKLFGEKSRWQNDDNGTAKPTSNDPHQRLQAHATVEEHTSHLTQLGSDSELLDNSPNILPHIHRSSNCVPMLQRRQRHRDSGTSLQNSGHTVVGGDTTLSVLAREQYRQKSSSMPSGVFRKNATEKQQLHRMNASCDSFHDLNDSVGHASEMERVVWYPKYTQQLIQSVLGNCQHPNVKSTPYQPTASGHSPCLNQDLFVETIGFKNSADQQRCENHAVLANQSVRVGEIAHQQTTAHSCSGKDCVSGHFLSLQRVEYDVKSSRLEAGKSTSSINRRLMRRSISTEGSSKKRQHSMMAEVDINLSPSNQPWQSSSCSKPTRAKSATAIGRRQTIKAEQPLMTNTMSTSQEHSTLINPPQPKNDSSGQSIIGFVNHVIRRPKKVRLSRNSCAFTPTAHVHREVCHSSIHDPYGMEPDGKEQLGPGQNEEVVMKDRRTIARQMTSTDMMCDRTTDRSMKRLRTITITITRKQRGCGQHRHSDQYDHLREKSKSHGTGISIEESWRGAPTADGHAYPSRCRADSEDGLLLPPSNDHSFSSRRHRDQYDFLSETMSSRTDVDWLESMYASSATVSRNNSITRPRDTTDDSSLYSTSFFAENISGVTDDSAAELRRLLSDSSVISTSETTTEVFCDSASPSLTTHIHLCHDPPSNKETSIADQFRRSVCEQLFEHLSTDMTSEDDESRFESSMKEVASEDLEESSPCLNEPDEDVRPAQLPAVVAFSQHLDWKPSKRKTEAVGSCEWRLTASRSRMKRRRPDAYITRRRMTQLAAGFSRRDAATSPIPAAALPHFDKSEKIWSAGQVQMPVIHDYAELMSFWSCHEESAICSTVQQMPKESMQPVLDRNLSSIGSWKWDCSGSSLHEDPNRQKEIAHYTSISEWIEVKKEQGEHVDVFRSVPRLGISSRHLRTPASSDMSTISRSSYSACTFPVNSLEADCVGSYKSLYYDPFRWTRQSLTTAATKGSSSATRLPASCNDLRCDHDTNLTVRNRGWPLRGFNLEIQHTVCDYITGMLFGMVLMLLLSGLQYIM